jgi:lipopolysaccharide transport system permease protein
MIAVRRAVDPKASLQAFREGGLLLTRYSALILEMARRELGARHAGQVMGLFWVIGQPLVLTLVYVVIFGVVFATRLDTSYELPLDFTAYILSGLLPWLSFLSAMSASCSSITGNGSLVKQFVFHLETLPAKDVVIALMVWVVGICSTLIYVMLSQHVLHLTWFLLPIVFALQVLAMLGVAFMLSAVTVFFRDLKELVQVFATINVFLMPVVYLPGWMPATFRPIIYANPFSYMIWVYQDVIYFGRIEHPWAWVVFAVSAVLVFSLGYRVFRKLKPQFANVL